MNALDRCSGRHPLPPVADQDRELYGAPYARSSGDPWPRSVTILSSPFESGSSATLPTRMNNPMARHQQTPEQLRSDQIKRTLLQLDASQPEVEVAASAPSRSAAGLAGALRVIWEVRAGLGTVPLGGSRRLRLGCRLARGDAYATQAADSPSACSNTVWVADSCLSGG